MAEVIPFRVGKAAPANTYLAIWMAEAAGLYEAQGLAIEVVDMVGGRDSGPALSTGRIHLMHIGMSSVVRANEAGADLVTVGSLSNVIRGGLFTAQGVTTAAGLKGGMIGISSTGSESDATATLALRRLGLSRDDVSFKAIGVERLAALQSGTVTAAMLDEPKRSEALAAGLRPLVDFLPERVPWLYSGLVVSRSHLNGNRGAVARFLKATIEGNYLALHDAARARDVMAGKLGLTDPHYIDIAYDNFRTLTPTNGEMSRAGAENIIATVLPSGTGRTADDYLDATVLDELQRAGVFDALKDKYAMC